MLIEWLRRNDAAFADHLKTYLYSQGSIVQAEREETGDSRSADGASSLRVGTLRGRGVE
jgi:hypothetical protein